MKAWIAKHTQLPSFETPPGEWQLERNGQTIAVGSGVTYLSDALAPIGVPLTYKLNASTFTLTRPDPGAHMLADANGRVLAPIRIVEDDWALAQDNNVFFPRNRPVPVVRSLRRFPRVTGEVQFVSQGGERGFFNSAEPVMMIHSPGACVFGRGCPVPDVRLLIADAEVRSRVGARRDMPTVSWSLSYTSLASSDSPTVGGTVPAVTYEEATAAGLVLTAGSFADVCKKIAGMP